MQSVHSHSSVYCIYLIHSTSTLQTFRLLARYPTKTAYPELHTNHNRAEFGFVGGSSLADISIENVVKQAPCILHLQGMDRMFNDPTQQHNAMAEDSQQELFFQALKSFQHDLYQYVRQKVFESSSEATTENVYAAGNSAGGVNSADLEAIAARLYNHSVVVVVSTECESKLKPPLKALFASIVHLSNECSCEAIAKILSATNADAQSHSNNKCNGNNSNDDDVALLSEHVAAMGGGVGYAKSLVGELRLHNLIKAQGKQWRRCLESKGAASNTNALNSKKTAFVPTPTPNSKQALSAVLNEVPFLNGFDTLNGGDTSSGGGSGGQKKSGNSRKQAKIAPVQWSDIGGLDR